MRYFKRTVAPPPALDTLRVKLAALSPECGVLHQTSPAQGDNDKKTVTGVCAVALDLWAVNLAQTRRLLASCKTLANWAELLVQPVVLAGAMFAAARTGLGRVAQAARPRAAQPARRAFSADV